MRGLSSSLGFTVRVGSVPTWVKAYDADLQLSVVKGGSGADHVISRAPRFPIATRTPPPYQLITHLLAPSPTLSERTYLPNRGILSERLFSALPKAALPAASFGLNTRAPRLAALAMRRGSASRPLSSRTRRLTCHVLPCAFVAARRLGFATDAAGVSFGVNMGEATIELAVEGQPAGTVVVPIALEVMEPAALLVFPVAVDLRRRADDPPPTATINLWNIQQDAWRFDAGLASRGAFEAEAGRAWLSAVVPIAVTGRADQCVWDCALNLRPLSPYLFIPSHAASPPR